MITGSTGTTEGSYTYTSYGGIETHTGAATTPLDYDGQYTNSDTGLVYLRARSYDPATAQFLSVDPAVEATRAPYTYASDNPLSLGDPSGRCNADPFSESFWTEGNCVSEGAGAIVHLLGGNAETISQVTGILAAGLALTPVAPVAAAFAAVSAATGAYAAGENAANAKYVSAALDSLGAVLGGEAIAYRVLDSIANAGVKSAQFLSELNAALQRASSLKQVAELLDKAGYGILATELVFKLGESGAC